MFIFAIVTALAVPCHLYFAGLEPTDFGGLVLSAKGFRFWISVAIAGSLVVGVIGTIVLFRIGIRAFQKMEL